MVQFHKSNKNQWTNKFARGENAGKEQTKSPSQLPGRAIKVIRLETENMNVGKGE